MAFAFFLAEAGWLPVQRLNERQTDVPGEGHQPPLAYALAAPLALWLAPEARQIELIGNPRFTWAGGAEVNAVSHGSREFQPWRGAVLAWHLMRLVSAALGRGHGGVYVSGGAGDGGAIADCRLGLPTRNQSDAAAGGWIGGAQPAVPICFGAGDERCAAGGAERGVAVAGRPRTENRPRTKNREKKNREPRTENRPSTKHKEQRTKEPEAPRTETHLIVCSPVHPLTRSRRWSAVALGAALGLALLTKQSAMILVPVAMLAVIQWRADADISWRAWLRRPLRTNTRFAPVHPFTSSVSST